jgi:ankyrin
MQNGHASVNDNTVVFVDACVSGDTNVMKLILQDDRQEVPLHILEQSHALKLAVAKGDVELTKLLLQKGVDVNTKSANDMTVLHAAAMASNIALCDLLIQSGAEINAKATLAVSGELLVDATPLSFAINSTQLMRLLIQSGADVNARVKRVQEPHYEEGTIFFSLIGTGKVEAMQYLADHGANLNTLVTTSRGSTHSLLYHTLLEGDADAIEILLQHHVDPNSGCENDQGFTSTLHEALMKKKFGFVQLLLQRSATVNSTLNVDNEIFCMKNGTALHFAAKYCASPEWTKLFLRHAARVNVQDWFGNTPLHYAVQVGNVPVIQELLNADANKQLKNNEEKLPMDLTTNPDIINLL